MLEIEVIEDPATASLALEPVRARILAELSEPTSAASLAPRVDLSRQKVNYHLRALEKAGLAKVAGERSWGGIKERLMVATAKSYIVSPGALGPVAPDPEATQDRLSASYLIALAARAVREVGGLLVRARKSGMRLATLSVDVEIGFRSPADRAAFTEELASSINDLVSRYHHEDGRSHRLIVLSHPSGRSSS